MSFKSVVVLGGGPIGLMCAIEAKQQFVKKVTIVEKRQGYSRTNVPQLQTPIVKHLQGLGLKDNLWAGRQAGDSVPFAKIEEALWAKAQDEGVNMERGYFVEGLIGKNKKRDGFYKTMVLGLKEWDDKKKQAPVYGATKMLDCDLLVVASGGGAIDDPILQKLGFAYHKLKAKNYGAFGIFNPVKRYDDPGGPQFDRNLQADVAPITKQIVSGQIGFHTPDHNYLLVTLSQCTKTDFKLLQQNTENLKKLLLAVGKAYNVQVLEQIKQVQKNLAVFKISIQRVGQFFSPEYPAVIAGDAAVTPHPEAGSGIGTGFLGFQELQKLFQALKQTHRSENPMTLFLEFNDSYELHVSRKALEGTIIVLRNQIKLLETFKGDVMKLAQGSVPKGMKDMAQQMSNLADGLINDMKQHATKAKGFKDHLDGGNGNLDWDATVGKLWKKIDATYANVKALTGDISLLGDRLSELQAKIKFT